MRTRTDTIPRRIQRPGMFASGDGSTLSLDFTAMSSLDPRFTFTRSTTATYINSSGLVTSMGAAASNDPTKARFDYDPITLTARGLLVEGSATNSIINSAAFTGTGWFTSGAGTKTITTNYGTAPDGTGTAARLQLGQNCALKQLAGTAGVNHTVSIWVKSNTGSNQTISFWTGTAAANRTATTSWTRIEAVVNFSSSTAFDFYNPNSGDCDILAWGAQLEAGSGASSYIPTTTSTVQRTADTCIASSTGFSSWFTGGTSGTFYADWYGGVRGITSTVRSVLSTSDVTARHLHLQQTAAAGNLKVADFGAANVVTTSNSITSGARTKGAFSFSGGTVNLTLNGGTVATSSSLAFSTAPTWLVLGGTSTDGSTITDGTVVLNGSIRAIKYWPSVLPNATLQSLTA